MLTIDETSVKQLKEKFPQYDINGYFPPHSWQTSRYVQIFIDGYDHDMHYEYRIDGSWNGRIELHFEGNGWESKYGELVDKLINSTENCDELNWEEWGIGYRCQYSKKIVAIEDLYAALSYMVDLFDRLIKDNPLKSFFERRKIEIDRNSIPQQENAVELYEKTCSEVMSLPLSIPNYQRIYCWEEENVRCLLTDVFEHILSDSSIPYRLGTIILHFHDGNYDIIDGQQRLVTLSLLLSELGIDTGLLNEKFTSRRSMEYVAYNKHLIQEYLRHNPLTGNQIKRLLCVLEFSVLVLQNTSIDLAYTFFSNQNSRGVELTDYDLLKAHHLRYIPSTSEPQSKHAAEVWNKMIENGRADSEQMVEPDYVRALDTYIYRLRKWMRKKSCDDSSGNYRIKKEYEAAPVIEEIPPFGENFYFNEPIQGGTHFFTYVERHIDKYRSFVKTEEYKLLHNAIQGGSCQWYRDIIESVLFCYFLKFGPYYLSDALAVVMRILLQHRYDNRRAVKSSIVQYAGDTELVLMIDQATSPTFFLAEARDQAKKLSYPPRQSMTPIRLYMRAKANNISRKLEKNIVVESLKNLNR